MIITAVAVLVGGPFLVEVFLRCLSPTLFTPDPWWRVLLRFGSTLLFYVLAALLYWLWWFWL